MADQYQQISESEAVSIEHRDHRQRIRDRKIVTVDLMHSRHCLQHYTSGHQVTLFSRRIGKRTRNRCLRPAEKIDQR